MRKDNLIDKPIAVSLFGTVASATLMVAFAIAYRIAGLFVPDTNAVMVAVHGIISLCGNILMFFTIATVASVIYSNSGAFCKASKVICCLVRSHPNRICSNHDLRRWIRHRSRRYVSSSHIPGGNWCAESTRGVSAWIRDNPVLRL